MCRVQSFLVVALLAVASATNFGDVVVVKAPEIEDLSGVSPQELASEFILGGEIVEPTDIPYAAGVILRTDVGTRWCGASLISANYALSVASCLLANVTSANVLLGASNMTDTTDIVPVAEWTHYNPITPQNDIALYRFNRAVVFGETIRPVRLPNWRQVQSNFQGQLATVSGWGSLTNNAPEILPLNDLRRVQIPIVSNTICAIRFPGQITDFHMCGVAEFGSPCQGDQGGPLTVADPDGRTTQVGIFSFITAFGCETLSPIVFTRLTPFLGFIQEYSDVVIRDDFEF